MKQFDFDASKLVVGEIYAYESKMIKVTAKLGSQISAMIVEGGNLTKFNGTMEQLKEKLCPTIEAGDIKHKLFDKIVSILTEEEDRMSVYLHGAAGAGKNVLCQQIADELGLKFYFATSVQDRFDLIGYSDALGKYVSTEFYQAFTEGGLFMLDEMDNSCEDALITMNSALANGYITFPIHGRKEAHPNFKVIAAGNTIGRGANELYTGRRPLDAATLNRFVFMEVGYDKRIEIKCAKGDSELVSFIRDCRKSAKSANYPFVASYRNIKQIAILKKNFSMRECLQMCLTKGMCADEIGLIHHGLADKMNKYAKVLDDLYRRPDEDDEE